MLFAMVKYFQAMELKKLLLPRMVDGCSIEVEERLPNIRDFSRNATSLPQGL